jgi:NAD(P)-dependent dehydrogenase (short-subunit alcohol dehydrogenase family)
MRRKLRDAVVVITGASSGIGRATALAFARKGASVVLASRSESALRQLALECGAVGVNALAVPTDTVDERSVDELAQRTMETFGRIDVWINNASVLAFGRFEDIPPDTFRRVVETNFFGYVNGARAALRCFRQSGGGVLVNNASAYAARGAPYISAFVASKSAVRGLTDSLRQELSLERGHHIHVVTVLPRWIDTPFIQHAANFTGRRPQASHPGVAPERVARAIVHSVRRPTTEVFVGGPPRLGPLVRALSPRLFDRLNARRFDRRQFTRAPAGPTEGNLRQPRFPETITGGWSGGVGARLKRAALVGAMLVAPASVGWLGWRRLRAG